MHFILKQILTHEESDSNRKGVNPLRDELGIGSVTGEVADRFDNESVWFTENPVRQLGRLGYVQWGLLGASRAACRGGKGGQAGPMVDRSKFLPTTK
jgi:hypothetical protein